MASKVNMMVDELGYLNTPHENPETVAFTRYADKTPDPELERIF